MWLKCLLNYTQSWVRSSITKTTVLEQIICFISKGLKRNSLLQLYQKLIIVIPVTGYLRWLNAVFGCTLADGIQIYHKKSELWLRGFLTVQDVCWKRFRANYENCLSQNFITTVFTEEILCELIVGKRWKNLTTGFFN